MISPTKHNPVDAYAPAEIASIVENIGVDKAHSPAIKTLVLAILAGAFIAYGAMLFTLVITDSPFGYGPTRWLGGIAFSLGLILVVVAGAELFTGNNLIVMAWASRRITAVEVLRNWSLVYTGNFIGAVATAWLISRSGIFEMQNGLIVQTSIQLAEAKVELSFEQAFIRGIFCNILVCLAVWLCMSAHSVSSKILAIVFPISAFVALGFEHSIANFYFIPLGFFLGSDMISLQNFIGNLLPVTIGNIVGGSGMVALVYWIAYLRK